MNQYRRPATASNTRRRRGTFSSSGSAGGPRHRRARGRGAALAGLVLAVATACSSGTDLADAEQYLDLSDDPMAASPIELATVDGESWRFTDVAQDRLTLLFFGYTSCPDVCPMTMAEIDLALENAGEAAEDFEVVMVSSDPDRDTDEQLRSWLDRFDPAFHGVRGDIDATVEAAQDYGIPIEAPQESEGEYLVSHGGRIVVLTPDGAAAGMFDEGVEADRIAELLPVLAEELL